MQLAMQVDRNEKITSVLFINSDLLFIDSSFSLHKNNNLNTRLFYCSKVIPPW